MSWFENLLFGHSVAQSVLVLGATVAIGLALGGVSLAGISLGVGGVMFAGLGVGGLAHLNINPELLEFVREFGLILFVYAIGLQVGPGFFASLRKQGLLLNGMAVVVVLLGSATAVGIAYMANVPLTVAVGLLTGAVTNTPSLGAAQQALSDLPGVAPDAGAMVGAGYAAAYPFGILGVITAMLVLRRLFRVDLQKEAAEAMTGEGGASLAMADFEVTNPELQGQTIEQLRIRLGDGVVVTRRLRDGQQSLVSPQTSIAQGDMLHAVGTEEQLERFRQLVGSSTEVRLPELSSDIELRRIVVTRKKVLGKRIEALALAENWGIVVSRVVRAGVEFAPQPDVRLHYGDRLWVVGLPKALDHVTAELGDQVKELDHPQILPVFLGIALGVILGSIPVTLGNMPAPVRLGLAGGPLIVAIIVGRLGRIGPFLCHVPNPAKKLLAEFGICLFLACVGLKSGERFVQLVVSGEGFLWMGLALLIAMLPILLVGVVGRRLFKLNFATLLGVMSGSMTDPPALAYANQISGNDAPSVSYATVYPLTMLMRVIASQLLVLWLMS